MTTYNLRLTFSPMNLQVVSAAAVALIVSSAAYAQDIPQKSVSGYVEEILLFPARLSVYAKLDTGAENSSLSAKEIEYFRRDDSQWVRFNLTNRGGETATFEQPLVRMAKIRRHFQTTQLRPVIRLGICLGDRFKKVEVNLVDRSGFRYQMLVGRSFLEGDFLINPGDMFLLEPICKTGL